jgi:hypothetical protein
MMDVSSLPSQFGRPEFYKVFDHDGKPGLVVIEMWRGRRWIVLYHQPEQQWIAKGRYVCCGPDGLLAWMSQEYAPRWLYGASVDGDGGYIVVEKGDFVWLLCYDGNMEYCCLLDMIEIPSLDIVACPLDQYLGLLLDNNAAIQLRGMLPILANICEVYLIETKDTQVAYMIEDTGFLRRLFRYMWVGGAWRCEGPFEVVVRDRWDNMGQGKADVSDVFEGRVALDTVRIVVEDGDVVRWWHTYFLQAGRWEFYDTHHAVMEIDDDGLIIDFDNSGEPDFVEDLNEEI